MEIAEQQLVSIALCTYNGENFLVKQLESLLSQSYKNIEIIAVDDCSGDNTWDILRDYAARDNRLFISQNAKNIGYTRNFEKAIKLCKGSFIALADQDDIWEISKITILMESVSDHVLVYHNSDFVDAKSERIGESTMGSRLRMYQGQSCLPFILSNCISGHAALFSKELLKYLMPFDERFYHDWWLAYVAFNIGKVKYVDEVLVHYRQHQASITDSLKLRQDGLQATGTVSGIERISLNLDWLQYCANFIHNKQPELINKAYLIFSSLARGRNRFSAFGFLMTHFDLLFYICYPPKSIFSKANMVRKICFN